MRLTRSNVIRFVDSTETAAVDIDAWLVVVTQDVGDVLADGGGMTMPVDDDVHAADESVETRIRPNSTWLVTSRVNTTRHVRARRDERVEPCCSKARRRKNAWARHVERVDPVKLVVSSVSGVSSSSRRACRVVLFDKLDTAKMHGLDMWTRHVERVESCRDVT